MSHSEGSLTKLLGRVSTFLALTLAVSLGVFSSNFAQAFETQWAQDSTSTKEISRQTGYEDVPEFGGPTNAGTQLRKGDAPKQPLYRFDQLQQLLSPYYGPWLTAALIVLAML